MEWIDLRSDTVTHPTPAMWKAMASAEVGDDVYGEDPTINRLESRSAERLGKEDALFVPSGTMGNLAAILTHCNRGDEMILGDLAHTFLYEAGGASALGGVHPHTIPNQADGTLLLDAIEAAVRGDDPHFPRTRLICLENTHNRCGGTVLTEEYTRAVGNLAHSHGLKLHLDGARIFNAAAALGVDAAALVEPVDSVTYCLSKALCAPVGSVLCGDKSFIEGARRIRKQLGGGMRQAGVLAAAGIVALETIVELLPEDHRRTKELSEALRILPGVVIENDPPQTNMIFLKLTDEAAVDGKALASSLANKKIKIPGHGHSRMRLVLHYWIDDEALESVIQAFNDVLGQAS
ncbi:MAG TPA: low-specificity L-threonine aldolase [Anaerolineae bacterium]|nr:low-specificity L-threonine aldolase [Anaerolineae bacterium]